MTRVRLTAVDMALDVVSSLDFIHSPDSSSATIWVFLKYVWRSNIKLAHLSSKNSSRKISGFSNKYDIVTR